MEGDWQIEASQRQCTSCEREFSVGDEYFSALLETAEGFSRRDYCGGCFSSRGSEEFFSFWKTRVPEPKERPRRAKFVGVDRLLDFFRRLEDDPDPKRQNFRYVLGLILLRKRCLKMTDVERSGDGDVLVLCEGVAKTVHRLPDPRLTDEEIADLSSQISEVLDIRATAEEE